MNLRKKNNRLMPRVLYLLFFFILTSQTFAADPSPIALPTTPGQLTIAEDDGNSYGSTMVQILNKTNAKSEIVEVKIGKKTTFGNISIIAHRCWQAPLDQKPESKMLLEIFETKSNQSANQSINQSESQPASQSESKPEKRIFYGWMFASSPSISGLEHPVYDVTALNCKSSKK